MPFKFSCFISYCHGNGKQVKLFVEKLHEQLVDRLDFYLDEPIFYDVDRLKPGYRFNEAIASAICQSACMIVVYVPKYRRKRYCLREFAAMEQLEKKRLEKLVGKLPTECGMIIPVVLRGKHTDLPSWITKHRHYCNLSEFATGTEDVFQSPDCIRAIEEIAASVNAIYEGFENVDMDASDECEQFSLPPDDLVDAMLDRSEGFGAELPNR